MPDQIDFLISNLTNLLIGFPGQRPGGLLLSILLALFGIGVGFMIGLIVGSGRGSRFSLIRGASRAFIEVFRGLPLILLLVLIHQVIGGRRFGLDISPRTAALISLALYSGAYQAEIVHAGPGPHTDKQNANIGRSTGMNKLRCIEPIAKLFQRVGKSIVSDAERVDFNCGKSFYSARGCFQ